MADKTVLYAVQSSAVLLGSPVFQSVKLGGTGPLVKNWVPSRQRQSRGPLALASRPPMNAWGGRRAPMNAFSAASLMRAR